MKGMVALMAMGLITVLLTRVGQPYQDRFVWVFGWGLGRDDDVRDIAGILDMAAKHGYNGAALSAGLDTVCKRDANYFRRLETVKQTFERNNLELIPTEKIGLYKDKWRASLPKQR